MARPILNMQTKKVRHGARGVRRVKTGCLTCKQRHNKCDERRPECSRCIKAGWRCDFLHSTPQRPTTMSLPREQHRGQPRDATNEPSSLLTPLWTRALHYPSAKPLLTEVEIIHMEYFHLICAKDFALFFDLPLWEPLILRHTQHEAFLHHAALAIGALSRSRYHPPATNTTSMASQPSTATSFAIHHYGTAMHTLHSRLRGNDSVQKLQLAALASVVFSQIEFLLGIDSQLEVHLRAGHAVLGELGRCDGIRVVSTLDFDPDAASTGGDILGATSRYSLLSNAILQLTAQVESFQRIGTARL